MHQSLFYLSPNPLYSLMLQCKKHSCTFSVFFFCKKVTFPVKPPIKIILMRSYIQPEKWLYWQNLTKKHDLLFYYRKWGPFSCSRANVIFASADYCFSLLKCKRRWGKPSILVAVDELNLAACKISVWLVSQIFY